MGNFFLSRSAVNKRLQSSLIYDSAVMLCVKLNEITRTPVEGVLKFIPTCVQGKEHCVGLDTLILLILKHTRALLGVGGIQYFVFILQVFFFSNIVLCPSLQDY